MELTPPPGGRRPDVLVIAGEHSGDAHAAAMVREFLRRSPGAGVSALGGPALAAAGAQLLHDLTASSVVGLVEVLRHARYFRQLMEAALRWIARHRPRVVCFVDYPGMNLRLAEALRRRGLSRKGGGDIATLYYISPQIWAWKGARRFAMARDLDSIAVIFPFEVESYADTALPVVFVGHPFVGGDGRAAPSDPVYYDPDGPVLLLPGSRRQAVKRIFPLLLAGHRLYGQRPAVVLYPSEPLRRLLEEILGQAGPGGPPIMLRPVQAGRVGGAAVLTSSGTMSMQCALAGIPGAIVYRANPATYALGRLLVQVPYLGIANLLLREPMYPEFIQDAATPAALAATLHACATDPVRRQTALAQAATLRSLLAAPAESTPGLWLAKSVGGQV